jgi:hypothetical protein
VWESEEALRAYLRGSPHREAMPKLFPWCDEAVTTHWRVESNSLPSWDEAIGELQRGGRLLRVMYPSTEQLAGVINLD